MDLGNVFEKQKKVEEEKKLEAVNSKESSLDKLLIKLSDCFEQLKPSGIELWDNFNSACESSLKDLRIQITPQLIREFQERIVPNIGDKKIRRLSPFFTALIQTSYNQGFNNFELGDLNGNYFGMFLHGKKGNKLRLKLKSIEGGYLFIFSNYLRLEAEKVMGWGAFRFVANCGIKAKEISGDEPFHVARHSSIVVDFLYGDYGFRNTANSRILIKNYGGKGLFGFSMQSCKIYSPSSQVLERLKSQMTQADQKEKNKFILIKP